MLVTYQSFFDIFANLIASYQYKENLEFRIIYSPTI